MKKLLVIIALALSTLTLAQETTGKKDRLTPEQQTELKVKQMTLDLDLSKRQQKDLKVILLEKAQKRQDKMVMFKASGEKTQQRTANERFEMRRKMLDDQIDKKAKMRKLLNESQFEKWETNKTKRVKQMKNKRSNRKYKRKASQEITE
ncbi:hypothetical protein ACFSX9_15080 [Flavobacterium ardleyense]|uniref:DUF4890 domain-containing protein n=1 Tax=Flavobacterium ardleyense TaxID=2038737 RepID=A0ABW5ZCT7_9FLAO